MSTNPPEPKDGERAPDFTLPMSTGEDVEDFSLEDALGDSVIVLAFFPGAFTSVCTEEMCEFRDSLDEFEELDAQVLGVSVDTPFALNEYAEKHGLNFNLLSDSYREVIEKYDVVYEDLAGVEVADRAVFVIDEDGYVRYRWVGEDLGVLPDIDEINGVVEEVRE